MRTVVFAVAALVGCHFGFSQDLATLIGQAEAKDLVMDTSGALALYKQAEKLEPGNVDVLIGIAKQYGESMIDEKTKEAKTRAGRTALAYSLKAQKLHPKHSDANLAVAVCYGRLMEFVSAKEKVEYSRLVKDYAEEALRLNPKSDYAWYMLARWHLGVATVNPLVKGLANVVYGGIPKGSNAEAVAALRKAIEINPNRLVHRIELGIALIASGKLAEGKAEIEKGLAMPNRERDDPSSKKRGQAALDKL